MLRINKILFPTDFTDCAESAFQQAVTLADSFDAELHVLNVVLRREHDRENPMNFLLLRKQDLHTWSDAFVRPTGAEHLRVVHAQAEVTTPARGIIEYADQNDVDLIVMATHGRRGLERLLVGSVSEEVVRLASCPVLVINRPCDPVSGGSIDTILVPIDFSDSSRPCITYAAELALAYGARLHLLHVIQETLLPTTYGLEPVAVAVPEVMDRSRAALVELVESSPGRRVETEYTILPGVPSTDITEVAEETGADLIVIATHGLTGIRRLLVGSVTERVVREAPCPVFTVKSFGKSLIASSPPVEGVSPADGSPS